MPGRLVPGVWPSTITPTSSPPPMPSSPSCLDVLATKRRKLSTKRSIPTQIVHDSAGSDTEEDEDAEEIAQFYLQMMKKDQPTHPISEKTFNEWQDSQDNEDEEAGFEINPTISALAEQLEKETRSQLDDDASGGSDSNSDANSASEDEEDVKYPSLPTLSSSSFSDRWVMRDPTPISSPLERRPKPISKASSSLLPAPSAQTPAVLDPSYRPRQPDDTMYHRGSAAVDPLGAHNRPLNSRLRAVAATTRQHRIISGSFGSFEPGRPSRFDERGYRLLPGEKRKRDEGGRRKGMDAFKRKQWLRRG